MTSASKHQSFASEKQTRSVEVVYVTCFVLSCPYLLLCCSSFFDNPFRLKKSKLKSIRNIFRWKTGDFKLETIESETHWGIKESSDVTAHHNFLLSRNGMLCTQSENKLTWSLFRIEFSFRLYIVQLYLGLFGPSPLHYSFIQRIDFLLQAIDGSQVVIIENESRMQP